MGERERDRHRRAVSGSLTPLCRYELELDQTFSSRPDCGGIRPRIRGKIKYWRDPMEPCIGAVGRIVAMVGSGRIWFALVGVRLVESGLNSSMPLPRQRARAV